MSYEQEVVVSEGACCENTRTLDHFCGNGTLIKKGMRSRCNNCGAPVDGEAWRSNDKPPRVYLRKYCAKCKWTSSRLSSDARFYYVPKEGEACGCGPAGCGPKVPLGENAKAESQLHTCTLVVEIVKHCNLVCPTCFSDAPHRKAQAGDILPLETLKKQIEDILDKQGKIDILQLSGGEPTLHPQLFEILAWLKGEERVSHVLLNTNGTYLAQPAYAEKIAQGMRPGHFGIYLQYDGSEKAGQEELRFGDFRKVREHALKNCAEYKIPVALVMTVTHDNKFDCASALTRALADENITWVVYQPEFISGRNDKQKKLEIPINVADIIHSVAKESVMDLDSWMPLPCSDPNCAMIGFLVRKDGEWYPASKFVDLSKFTSVIANRVNYSVDDTLEACGCDDYNLGEYLKANGFSRADVKMVFIKPFMDVRTWDEARIAACCTHVVKEDGSLDSFCRHYANR